MENQQKPYDLEERTYLFALSVRLFLRQHKWDPVSWSDVKQEASELVKILATIIRNKINQKNQA